MARTAQQDLALMKEIQKQIDSGKIKGKKNLFRAGKSIAALKFSAKKKMQKSGTRQVEAVKAGQTQLPNFLAGLNNARIEELVARMVVDSLLSGQTKREETASEVTPVWTLKSVKRA